MNFIFQLHKVGFFSCLGCMLFSAHQFLYTMLLLQLGVLVPSSVKGNQTAAHLSEERIA